MNLPTSSHYSPVTDVAEFADPPERPAAGRARDDGRENLTWGTRNRDA
jgi:hypothetical protein